MAAEGQIDRTERVVQILMLLVERRRMRLDVLADKFRVSRRTIFRDLATLQRAGVQVRYDSDDESYRMYSQDVA